jgi:hypothetical protein
VLADLHRAWTAEQGCREQLAAAQWQHDLQRALADQHPENPESAAALQQAERALAASRQELTDVRSGLARLTREPALAAQPADRLARERSTWRAHQSAPPPPAPPRRDPHRALSHPRPEELRFLAGRREPTCGIPR